MESELEGFTPEELRSFSEIKSRVGWPHVEEVKRQHELLTSAILNCQGRQYGANEDREFFGLTVPMGENSRFYVECGIAYEDDEDISQDDFTFNYVADDMPSLFLIVSSEGHMYFSTPEGSFNSLDVSRNMPQSITPDIAVESLQKIGQKVQEILSKQ